MKDKQKTRLGMIIGFSEFIFVGISLATGKVLIIIFAFLLMVSTLAILGYLDINDAKNRA